MASQRHAEALSEPTRSDAPVVVPARPQVSVIIPCLNEEEAVGKVVDQASEGIRLSGRVGEIVVVDNGSTDRSGEVAAAHGAIVVSEPRRGYGSAYLAGLEAARGEYLVMGDADDTYPLNELAGFVDRLESGDDLVIGSRFKGTIHGDAMPFLNRFVGNPVLTGMLNVLFGVKVSDAHCGMRAVCRAALPVLDLHSTGMEFASEMVFKAYRRGLTVSEVPIDYYPRVGESKLNRFTDAWRHVRFMLLYSPSWLYLIPGGLLLLLGMIGMVVLAAGPIDILGHTWQIHTMLGFVAMTLIGAQGTGTLPFELRGDVLTLMVNGLAVKLDRASEEKGGVAGAGGVRMELVGKWCWMTQTNVLNGARQSNRCLTLNGNGSYLYEGLTDSYGPNGGATGQSSDAGTWTATENTITAHSRSGKTVTYRLEKRNHPKNVRDPMIVLDGQPFVTFYNKPPW